MSLTSATTGTCDSSNPWLAFPAVVKDVVHETPGVATYRIRIQDEDAAPRFRFRPGQFNMLYLPGVGEIAISVSGDPATPFPLLHTIREAGTVTRSAGSLGPGCHAGTPRSLWNELARRGMCGQGRGFGRGGNRVGPVAPGGLRAAGRTAALRQSDIALRSAHAGRRSLHFRIRRLDKSRAFRANNCGSNTRAWNPHVRPHRGFGQFHFFSEQGKAAWTGHVGVVTLLLERLPLPRPRETVLMTCGPEVMMWYTTQTARERGLPVTNLWMSLERNMNCAVGLCGHCQFGPAFICKDGPVFRFDRIAPFLEVKSL